jgi:aldose 1-epimerase
MYSIPESGTFLNITMNATVSKPTILNIINHNYFNLKGAGKGTILDHVIQMPSLFYTPAPAVRYNN